MPRVRVLRDGKIRRIPADRLTEGDIFLLDSGEMVPCDARILASERLTADESRIGFSPIAPKDAEGSGNPSSEDPFPNLLYACTEILTGSVRAIAVRTARPALPWGSWSDGPMELEWSMT